MLSRLTCVVPSFPSSQMSSAPQNLHARNPILNNTITYENVKNAKPIHARTNPTLLFFNLRLQLYVNASAMLEARALFDKMLERSLITWTILMSGYTRHGPASEVLAVFWNMLTDHNDGLLLPDSFVYAVVLRACTVVGNLSYGKGIHGQIVKRSDAVDSVVENALLNMYMSCGSVWDADVIFAGIVEPGLVAWSSMISGYVKNGFEEEGLLVFYDMILNGGVKPDAFAFSMVVGACADLGCLEFGIQIHCNMIKMGYGSCLFLENNLLDFYAKCGNMEGLRQIFSEMSEKNLVSWNTLITGYAYNFYHLEALQFFRVLMEEVSLCDEFTLVSILKAVTSLGELSYGREIHGYIIRVGLESNHCVISSLLGMYIECIDLDSLDLRIEIPLKLFNNLEGGEADEYIIASMLKWCSLISDMKTGQMLHSLIIKHDMKSDPYVISSLLEMYLKCGMVEAAQRVFQRVKEPGTAPWSALISGYNWNGRFTEALRLFRKMQLYSVEANEFTFTSALLACSALADIKKGRELHNKILRAGYGSNASVVNMLINLYSELWHHKQALKLCSLIPDAEIPWNILIQACLRAKDYEMIQRLLWRIQTSHGDLDLNSVCIIFNSCSSPVLSNVGKQAHAYMTKRGLISHPIASNCLIEMYSEYGNVTDAVSAFNSMPEKDSHSWLSIISTRAEHGHPSEALNLFAKMPGKQKSENPGAFASAFNAYAQLGLVDSAYRLFMSMRKDYGVEPSEEHYSCMVGVLGEAGMFEEVLDFITGVSPNKLGPQIWKTLLSSARVHGNMNIARYAAEKLLELEPSDFSANVLLEQVLLVMGRWDYALKLKPKNKPVRMSSSRIEIRNRIHEFVSDLNLSTEVSAKIAEIEDKMEELGYMADRYQLLQNAEEEEYGIMGDHHTEMKALAFGLISLPDGVPIRVIKSIRMCGDCHSIFKFISTFIERELVVKDPCKFHHFRDGKCSCRGTW